MGGSALAHAMEQIGNEAPDVRDVDLLSDFFDALSQLHESGIVLAYHDQSDGGLFTTLVEMMFAGRCGAEIMLDRIAKSKHLLISLMRCSMKNLELSSRLGNLTRLTSALLRHMRPSSRPNQKNRTGSCNFKTEAVHPLWPTVDSQS